MTSGAGGNTMAGGSAAGGRESDGGEAGPDEAGSSHGAGAGAACVGLECAVPKCDFGSTTLAGKVYDPSGTLPLYNVTVFVPNAALPALEAGPTCQHCGELGVASVTSTTTDATGSFVLENAPAGPQIPLTMQVGKWRRQVVVRNVLPCSIHDVDPELTRLPRNKKEGDLPRIAIAAGAADQMECLPRRMGIDDSEFTTSSGDGSIHLFTGHYDDVGSEARVPITRFSPQLNDGAALPSADTLWESAEALAKYDMVLLSCEGNSFPQRKPAALRKGMYDYLASGGRVLASHWHHIWFSGGPPELAGIGSWSDRRDPTDPNEPITATINHSFLKGAAFAEWMVTVGASAAEGEMVVEFPRDNLQAGNPELTREWITVENPRVPAGQDPKTVQYMSFTAPVGAPLAQACGRAAFTGLHVSDQSDTVEAQLDFPLGCENRALSAQEKAIAFMLFELSSCIDDRDIP